MRHASLHPGLHVCKKIDIKRNKKENQLIAKILQLTDFQSGKRDSNSRPSAWEADALPTELLPQ